MQSAPCMRTFCTERGRSTRIRSASDDCIPRILQRNSHSQDPAENPWHEIAFTQHQPWSEQMLRGKVLARAHGGPRDHFRFGGGCANAPKSQTTIKLLLVCNLPDACALAVVETSVVKAAPSHSFQGTAKSQTTIHFFGEVVLSR